MSDSYRSLMAAMSLVENKRGIAEVENVTRVTELAFFFIPLLFSARDSSMQQGSWKVSIAAFFI